MRTVYASIRDIIPVTKNWKVKMLVAEKSPKRIARNSITKYQNLTLIDPQGNRLQAVIFGKDIDLRDDTLQVFQSYYIGNAYVKAIDPRHKIESHEYQWIINSRTIIENIEDDEPVLKAPEYNIIPFNELDAYKDTDSEIEILAIAIQMMPPREVNTVNGKATVQDIQLIDESLKPLTLTMWARFVHDECQQISNIIATKPIILGMRIKVGLSLSSQVTSVFTIDPLLPAAVSLRTWATQNDALLEEIIAKGFNTSTGSSSSNAMQTITKISEIAEILDSTQAMTKSTFTVKAKFLLLDLHQPFYYMSCVNCNKATGYDYNEKFSCYNCKNMSIGQPRSRVYLEIEDDTGCIAVVAFGLVAEEILNFTAVHLLEHTGEEHLPYL
ncbi:replication protein A 70 kDa DNA-binding subunit B-like [Carya illinoinensis]|uniref:replication protein A 70 kDa DNA-binding subunit B-like n=1 Tax=Carya illinoinensis TaxID=32201 RepID=UPI001C71DABD|nr:replication protein A 70 kDa DNA-binding subunit B-like [Carya illinoinensis]